MATESNSSFTGILSAIPGYRGYRSKEDRRDQDRHIRDAVAANLEELADRVEDIARSLADTRQITAIGPVDDFAKALRHVINRVSSASYGYGGLFGNRDIDEQALDQLQEFDESLMVAIGAIETQVKALEDSHEAGTSLNDPAAAGSDAVRTFNRLFDSRAEVISTAKPAPKETIQSILGPGGSVAPPAIYNLHQHDAVTIGDENYVVDARIEVQAGADSFRLFRIDEASRKWLLAPSNDQRAAFLVVESSISMPEESINQELDGTGEGTVVAGDRKSDSRPIKYSIHGAGDGEFTLVLKWPDEQQVFSGKEIAFEEIEIYPASSHPA